MNPIEALGMMFEQTEPDAELIEGFEKLVDDGRT